MVEQRRNVSKLGGKTLTFLVWFKNTITKGTVYRMEIGAAKIAEDYFSKKCSVNSGGWG